METMHCLLSCQFQCLCLGFFHCNCNCFHCFFFQFLFPLAWSTLFSFLTISIAIALVANVSMAYLVHFSCSPFAIESDGFFSHFIWYMLVPIWLFLAISIIAQLSLLVMSIGHWTLSKTYSIVIANSCHSSCWWSFLLTLKFFKIHMKVTLDFDNNQKLSWNLSPISLRNFQDAFFWSFWSPWCSLFPRCFMEDCTAWTEVALLRLQTGLRAWIPMVSLHNTNNNLIDHI